MTANPTPPAPDEARRAELKQTAEKLRILANQLAVCDCHDARCIVAAAKAISADELHYFEQAASAATERHEALRDAVNEFDYIQRECPYPLVRSQAWDAVLAAAACAPLPETTDG